MQPRGDVATQISWSLSLFPRLISWVKFTRQSITWMCERMDNKDDFRHVQRISLTMLRLKPATFRSWMECFDYSGANIVLSSVKKTAENQRWNSPISVVNSNDKLLNAIMSYRQCYNIPIKEFGTITWNIKSDYDYYHDLKNIGLILYRGMNTKNIYFPIHYKVLPQLILGY